MGNQILISWTTKKTLKVGGNHLAATSSNSSKDKEDDDGDYKLSLEDMLWRQKLLHGHGKLEKKHLDTSSGEGRSSKCQRHEDQPTQQQQVAQSEGQTLELQRWPTLEVKEEVGKTGIGMDRTVAMERATVLPVRHSGDRRGGFTQPVQ